MIAVVGGLVIGLCLGLLGSGGSILTVPLLVYLLDHEPKAAIAESLAIVGGIALVASIRPMLKRDVDWTSLVLFGIPGVLGTVAGVWCSQWISGVVQLVVFSIVMLVAAAMMLRGRRGGDAEEAPTDRTRRDHVILVVEGLVVGALTGLVGVGGGFLIVPALVLLGRLPMRLAVGTSLLIIAIKSGAGFAQSIGQMEADALNLQTIGIFVLLGGVGSFAGNAIGGRIPQRRLKQVFAVFLLVMGVVILATEGRELLAIDDVVSGRAATVEDVGSE
ncbi:MAG: sulfite exporter TauE/SafE family protein [Planctomycetota bacterium]